MKSEMQMMERYVNSMEKKLSEENSMERMERTERTLHIRSIRHHATLYQHSNGISCGLIAYSVKITMKDDRR